ncbi:MAG TPA: hypothetical protein IAC12_03625 [Candidatus Aphodovivens avistercoris]|nr:hypothetical protein [Candidatus Aphodovivens avistercoris]
MSLILGWVSALSAVAAAVGAIASAVIARKVYLSQTSPDVIVYVGVPVDGKGVMHLFVENIGNAPAWDTRIALGGVPMKDGSRPSLDGGALGNGIPFLPPGGKRVIPLDVSHEFVREMEGKSASAEVTFFRRKGGKSVSASFPIEGDSFKGSVIERTGRTVAIESVASEVGKLRQAVSSK